MKYEKHIISGVLLQIIIGRYCRIHEPLFTGGWFGSSRGCVASKHRQNKVCLWSRRVCFISLFAHAADRGDHAGREHAACQRGVPTGLAHSACPGVVAARPDHAACPLGLHTRRACAACSRDVFARSVLSSDAPRSVVMARANCALTPRVSLFGKRKVKSVICDTQVNYN